ncbi:MAG: right-handed parallel beta-helix repeat-containing protein, partial [Phycisphaerae bacterium]
PGGGDTYRALINEFGGVSSLEVRGNKFTGWHTGIYLQNADAAVVDNVMLENYVGMSIDGATSVTVEDNSFTDNGLEGLGIGPPPVTSLTITGNCFSGNTAGISNWQSVEIDARYNSFADASGPYNPTSNPDGQGDSVSDNIIYEPWLAACCGDPLHQPPVGDLITNCRVDFYDYSVLALAWLAEEGDANWNADTNLDATDDIIDENDLDIFVQHWLDCTDSDCD